jgi:hypothetical protein
VAPAGYTKGAVELAESTDLLLFDADSVRRWIRKADKLEKERAGETASEIRDSPAEITPISKEIAEASRRAIWHAHPDDPPKGWAATVQKADAPLSQREFRYPRDLVLPRRSS